MKRFHTKGRENSGNCACFPLSWGRGPGEGERFLQSHFRNRRRISDETPFPPRYLVSYAPLPEAFSGIRCPSTSYFNHAGNFSSFQMSRSFWRWRTTADLLPWTSTSDASARVL